MESGSSFTSQAWQYGVLGIVALVFGYAIIHLFRALRADQAANRAADKERERERAEWAIERKQRELAEGARNEQLRAEYERKHRELAEGFTQALREERDANREHEDGVRREFAELMETISAEAAKSSAAIVEVMSKFYDRLVGPRSRR